ncbi:lipoprotein ABC transporter permease [Cryobacterium suzukii]|uniref:Lipoprotein ABC transporter permease n=1 Tax=Cryobacterium suzukii TaxID=1259198 RepID=A0A4R9ABE8_9MICO|nr:FtsX-like permease family protein [Cryobacterium suzukii]TFD56754.1 lipoprotein ABC transporter permease [Cryobacterium suzukii]
MTALGRWAAVVREALATAWAQPVASIVTIVMVAGMCATVLLTTGRTVGAEQAVLGSIDSEGTRSIVIRAEPDAGLDATVLERLAHIDGIQWAGAFGGPQDVTNIQFPGATKIPLRLVWSSQLEHLGITSLPPVADASVWASPSALAGLGMPDAVGGVVDGSGIDFAVTGRLTTPDFLAFLEPLAIAPQTADTRGIVSVLVIIADRPDLVAPVSEAAQSVLGVTDPTKVTLTTSENLAALRGMVEGQLDSFGRSLVIVIFGLTAVLVAAILYGLVMLRRKDFGRRRALGASQTLIIVLLLTQTGALALVGATIGSIAASIGLTASGDPLPGWDFVGAVALLSTTIGVIAALVPALAAARRDPLKELRVP